MLLGKFDTYEAYVAAQRKSIHSRHYHHAFFTWVEIRNCCEFAKARWGHDGKGCRGICHGARNGLESDEFTLDFEGSTVIGTDLFPFSGTSREWGGKSEVVEWDFSKVNPEWTGKMDFVYSNSLDHSSDPEATLKTWMGQLKPTGLLFLQWSDCLASGIHRGDCFVCDVPELERMVARVGFHLTTWENDCPYDRTNPMACRALKTRTIVGTR